MHNTTPNQQDAELVKASVAALDSYDQTGRRITLDEAESWMKTWGTPGETNAPVCHATRSPSDAVKKKVFMGSDSSDDGYRAMAEDKAREGEAMEWCNALAVDIADAAR